MNDHVSDADEHLGRRLAAELPRYTAPASLRVAIVQALDPAPSRRPAWLSPLLAAAATAMVLAMVMLPLLPRMVPSDPSDQMLRAVVSEHSRALMWGSRQSQVIPAALPWLQEQSGIELSSTFVGDDLLTFVSAEPVYLLRQRGLAVHYRDTDGHLITYIALPGGDLKVPDRSRVQIERYRPALVRDSGFVTWVWKQRDVACFLVSDMVSTDDLERFKDYFVRVRASTEPSLAY
ncbi:MAG TPA: hypothetical protein VHZ49_17920 [Methylomirabilota bacterium]|jgi:hypothetical protein|nr:hypothetical protein [Methylomirabilota bacterium]